MLMLFKQRFHGLVFFPRHPCRFVLSAFIGRFKEKRTYTPPPPFHPHYWIQNTLPLSLSSVSSHAPPLAPLIGCCFSGINVFFFIGKWSFWTGFSIRLCVLRKEVFYDEKWLHFKRGSNPWPLWYRCGDTNWSFPFVAAWISFITGTIFNLNIHWYLCRSWQEKWM